MEELLKVTNITKRYIGQATDAVTNTTFAVNRGELFVLVGESGCGKTTLLKLIAGLEDPDSGNILLENKIITGPSHHLVPGHKEVKMVFQDFRLFPNITVYENIRYQLRAYHHSYQTARIHELLHVCKLAHVQHKYPREISGGEQQRTALASALADEPVLLLLDEPFSNIDALLKQELKNDIADIITDSKTTALLVTHDTNEALSMADTVAVMKEGRIVQEDKPQIIYQKPASPYIARFFGSANILPLQWLMPYIQDNLQMMESLPENKHTAVCIRAEHIYICARENCHFMGRIIRINYMGAYYEVFAEINNQLQVQFHTTEVSLHVGDHVPLQIKLSSIHFFADFCW